MSDAGGSTGSRRSRFVVQTGHGENGPVIRVFDTQRACVHREIPIDEFVAYARNNRNVRAFLLGLPGAK